MKMLPTLFAISLFSCLTTTWTCQAPEITERPPNIILIMADDVGFSDIGSYGSEIQTPNLDRLARQGLRFRQFYNQAKCNPTRSSLLTGLYQGGPQTQSVATWLGEAGYTTLMSGKEHFDPWVPEACYARNSFDHSFTFWMINEFLVPPSDTFAYPFVLNGTPLATHEIPVEKPPFHKTDVLTDMALRFLDTARQTSNPYFLYLPYHAAHYPLQASPEDIAKYREGYRVGWDEIRTARFERQKELGILTENASLSPPTDNIHQFRGHPKTPGDEERRGNIPLYRPWESLTEQEQEDLSLEMAVFAAMVDRMDQNIGRLLSKLEAQGELDNTLILFLSDNGSCPYDSNKDFSIPPGPANSYRTLGAAWANVGNTPFRYFKQFGHEGGPHTHLIAHWPDQIAANSFTDQAGHVVDLAPTLLEIAGHAGPTYPLDGSSLVPVLKGKQRLAPAYLMAGMRRFRMYREGDWKLVQANDGNWELYNLQSDPTELENLALSLPDQVARLEKAYEARQAEMNARNKE